MLTSGQDVNVPECKMLRFWLVVIGGLLASQSMRIVVNIPAYRVDAYVDDSLVRTMPIAVGMRGFRTPRGQFAVTSIDWNPWWIPPNNPWAAKEKRTPPGPTNPMGRVKINFQPLYFLHGTPARQSIGSAASHGCIRMLDEDAIDLARLVHQFATPAMRRDELDQLATDTTRTHTIQLDSPVPIEIRYDLAELRDGRVMVYRDVYGLATRPLRDEVYALLAQRGIDTMQVDSARVRVLVRRVARAGNSVAVDSIVRGAPRL
jgi:murein L,D-transpeptidase YcbB/YkuD